MNVYIHHTVDYILLSKKVNLGRSLICSIEKFVRVLGTGRNNKMGSLTSKISLGMKNYCRGLYHSL